MIHRFGDFVFDDERLALWHAGERLKLQRKVLEVLAVLVRHPGEVIARERVLLEVWQGAHVEAAVLTQAIFLLRKALGDTPSQPRFVATIQGRGYVFLEKVARVDEETSPDLASSARNAIPGDGRRRSVRGHRSRWALAACLGVLALLAARRFWPADALGGSPGSRVAAAAPGLSPRAREAYLEARHLLSQRNERGLGLSLAYFERAIELAPDHAPGHAGLAEAEALMGAYDYGMTPPIARYERAERAARRAVELDPRSGEGWAVLGLVSLLADLDTVEAQRRLDRAVAHAPRSARAHHWRAWVLFVRGHPEAAEQELGRARALDPLSPIVRTAQATLSFYRGRLSEARARYQGVLELEPTFARARLGLGLVAEQEGDLVPAERHLRLAASQLGDPEEAWAALAHLYGRARRPEDWQQVFSRLGEERAHPLPRALAWLGAGDERRALQALRDGIDERRLGPWELVGDPRLRGIAGPELDGLLSQAGLRSAAASRRVGRANPRGPWDHLAASRSAPWSAGDGFRRAPRCAIRGGTSGSRRPPKGSRRGPRSSPRRRPNRRAAPA